MLEIEALAFAYPKSATRYDFTLRVGPGEVVGLEGPSGSGKSTLFDLVAGFLVPQSGEIRVDGASILGQPPEARPVSILFQSDNLFEHLTAGANVAMGLPGRARPDDPRVLEALEAMGLGGLAPRRAGALSGGQKQRVALARTLLRDRKVLLLDEPFTGLDEATAAPIRALIGELVRRHGWRAILVSHQGADLDALAARRYRLEDGRLETRQNKD